MRSSLHDGTAVSRRAVLHPGKDNISVSFASVTNRYWRKPEEHGQPKRQRSLKRARQVVCVLVFVRDPSFRWNRVLSLLTRIVSFRVQKFDFPIFRLNVDWQPPPLILKSLIGQSRLRKLGRSSEDRKGQQKVNLGRPPPHTGPIRFAQSLRGGNVVSVI